MARRGPAVRGAIELEIYKLWTAHPDWTAGQVRAALPTKDRPQIRAIQTRLARFRREEAKRPGVWKDEPWDWGHTDYGPPRASRALLDTWVLARDIGHGVLLVGPPGGLSKGEADRVEQIRRVAPDMKPQDLLTFGSEYYVRERAAEVLGQSISFKDLDCFLAHAPWRSRKPFDLYLKAIQKGIAPRLDFAGSSRDFIEKIWGAETAVAMEREDEEDVRKFSFIVFGRDLSEEDSQAWSSFWENTIGSGLLPSQVPEWLGRNLAGHFLGKAEISSPLLPWPGEVVVEAWNKNIAPLI